MSSNRRPHLLSIPSIAVVAALALQVFASSACDQAAIEANQKLVQQQQAQIEQNQMEIEKLKAQRGGSGGGTLIASAAAPAGFGCDKAVMAAATRHGGAKMAAGDFAKALGYYRDALTACPGNARAELNVARAYEASGDRTSAIAHFRAAAQSTDPTESSAEAEARNAMVRLGAN